MTQENCNYKPLLGPENYNGQNQSITRSIVTPQHFFTELLNLIVLSNSQISWIPNPGINSKVRSIHFR